MPAVLAQTDPTGFSSPFGQLVVLIAMLAALVVLIRGFRHRR